MVQYDDEAFQNMDPVELDTEITYQYDAPTP